MIDVVLPAYITNDKQLTMTMQCISKARKNTKLPFNLIIVETVSNYLNDYADIYIYEKNRTTADISINRGFYCCKNEHTVLLTNDVLVEENWLECLMDCFCKKNDCGASTLASNQFFHVKQDKIEEGIWGSVFMIPTRFAKFDENYINSWEDSDLWMNIYNYGKKMYRNFNCVVSHDPGQTVYKDDLTQNNYERNRSYFINKWKDSNIPLFKVLTEGTIL